MPHKLRRCEPNLTYHTYSRCIDSASMMRPDRMKLMLLGVMAMAQKKYVFELISYVIMDNHFHFIIRTVEGGAPISRIMQYIKARFSQRYNRLVGRTGPFWNERYGDVIVEEQDDPEEAFHRIHRYLMNDPVRAGHVRDAGNYRYSSIHFYLDEGFSPTVKLTCHEYYLRLGISFQERARRFKRVLL